MKLYHWTCNDHGADKILESGLVIPGAQTLLGVKLSWWSHVPWAGRAELGLTSALLRCDRMGMQFVADVEPGQVSSWSIFRTGLMQQRPDMVPIVRALEAAKGTKPGYWWVAPEEIPVKLVVEAPA